ncbi:1-phosphofructokinase [Saccharothrix variisporea]|uniref:1-phosphofructokinase n=1 Tax=Saccharothrix variisporea TaxID=543527 RepID=A0A495X6F0_9PSEU|nr:1-phosphofructokinase [Saccharothrix variisporea]RKT69109.1 fructose-1-phosphate kinase [Saccharothrix variisporea]
MFLTVTANPSVDRTVEVARLTRGELHRAAAVHVQPGGKGINVARALVRNGHQARAVVPAGGPEGDQLIRLLTGYRVEVVRVEVAGPVRSNITVVEPDATVTKINEAGAPLSAAERESLLGAVLDHASGVGWVVAAGSLPPGVPDEFYADLIHRLAPIGVPVAVDTSGAALPAAVKAGPALVKPNLEELAEVVDRPLRTLREVVDAAGELRSRGAAAVLASLGGHGAVLVDGDGTWHAEARAQARSSVGAGDALLAGFLAAGGRGPSALAAGVAWGAAAVSLPGSTMPGPEDVRAHRVVVHPDVEWERRIDT